MIYTVRNIGAALLILLSFNCSHSEKVNTTIAKNDNSILWKIEKEGHKTSYLFGTIHLTENKYYNFNNQLIELISNSETVILELRDAPDPIQSMILLKSNSGTIENKFSSKDYETILTFFENKLNINKKQFKLIYNNFKPFVLIQAITQGYFEGIPKSYDLDIIQLAKNNNKNILGLETLEQQLAFFDSIPFNEISELILSSINNFENDKAEMIKLQKSYQNQNIIQLLALLNEQSPELMKYNDLLLNNRNKNWLPNLVENLNENACFIAVGAAHLYEHQGIIELLRSKKFKLTPLEF